MATITTKFDVGDIVYAAQVDHEPVPVKCPDCLGTRKWKAILPSSEELSIACPSCNCGYEARGTINEYRVTGQCLRLTIGSVRMNVCEDGIEYMCKETGVGTGHVWKESLLFSTEAEVEAILSRLIEERRIQQLESAAKQYAHKKSCDGINNKAGGMTAYYRNKIRDCKKQIKDAEEGLSRIANMEAVA